MLEQSNRVNMARYLVGPMYIRCAELTIYLHKRFVSCKMNGKPSAQYVNSASKSVFWLPEFFRFSHFEYSSGVCE